MPYPPLETESLYIVRRFDKEPIDDNLVYIQNDWDEAVGVASEIAGDFEDMELEVIEAVVIRGERFPK